MNNFLWEILRLQYYSLSINLSLQRITMQYYTSEASNTNNIIRVIIIVTPHFKSTTIMMWPMIRLFRLFVDDIFVAVPIAGFSYIVLPTHPPPAHNNILALLQDHHHTALRNGKRKDNIMTIKMLLFCDRDVAHFFRARDTITTELTRGGEWL